MQSTKLIILLKSLSPEEFRRFQKFLNSPFYNYSKPLTALYDLLKKHYPKFDSPKLKKERVWKKLFQDESFDEAKYWRLTSKLSLLTEKFLAVLELENQPDEEKKLVIHSFEKRNLNPFFEKEVHNFLKEPKNKPSFESNFQSDKILLLEKLFYHLKNNKSEKAAEIPPKILNELDRFYFQQRLKISGTLKGSESMLRKKHNSEISNFITETINKHPEYQIPVLTAYKNLYQFIENQDVNSYWELKKSLLDSFEVLGIDNQKYVFQQLINFAIGQVNKGFSEFRKENFDLYKLGIEKRWLFENNGISDITFTNIASLGANLKEFEWIEDFVEHYAEYLNEEKRENARALSMGFIRFHQKKYWEVINLFLNQRFLTRPDLLRSKTLLLQSYFELMLQDDTLFELFYSYSKSYEKFIRRDTVFSEKRMNAYLNFILLVRRISKLKVNLLWNEKERNKIKNRLKREDSILKNWLNNRLEGI